MTEKRTMKQLIICRNPDVVNKFIDDHILVGVNTSVIERRVRSKDRNEVYFINGDEIISHCGGASVRGYKVDKIFIIEEDEIDINSESFIENFYNNYSNIISMSCVSKYNRVNVYEYRDKHWIRYIQNF